MRYAYVATTVADRDELGHGPIDTGWLLDQRPAFEPLVLIDHETPGSQRLREGGIDVIVSGKRPSQLPSGVTLSADHVQARLLLQEHRRTPFDFILYSSGVTTDLAWFETALSVIPRGVALGEGPVLDQRLVTGDASLFLHFGRMLWGGTGFVTTADFLLGDVPASAYGFKDEALPPRFGSGLLDGLAAPARPEDIPELLVVVATTEDSLGLGRLLPRVAAAVPIDGRTCVVVVHRNLPVGPESTRQLILGSCPPELVHSTILTTPGEDGSAAGFVDRADFVVVAGPGDLAIRSVVEAARRTGYALLRSAVPEAMPILGEPPVRRDVSGAVTLVRVPERFEELGEILDGMASDGEPQTVVLHGRDYAEEARRFVDFPRLGHADLAILSEPDPVYGSPNPYSACTEVLAVGPAAWPSIRRRVGSAASLWELIRWSMNLDLAEHVRLLVLPGSGRGCQILPAEQISGLPVWITSTGALPRPNLVGDTGQRQPSDQTVAIRDWAATHSWAERVRLALPWRAGLLDRAMRDKW